MTRNSKHRLDIAIFIEANVQTFSGQQQRTFTQFPINKQNN